MKHNKLKDIDPNELIRQARKSELDRRGVSKTFKAFDKNSRKHRNFRATNYFYRVFDHIGRQLNDQNKTDNINSGLHRAWDFFKPVRAQNQEVEYVSNKSIRL
jgi:hypothetical protein